MDLIAHIIGSPKGIFALSSVISAITVVAILTFGLPLIALLVVAWGGSILLAASDNWVNRRLGRR